MRHATVTGFALVLALAFAAAPGFAAERIHLKNGRIVEVLSSRVEGPMVFVKLKDGAEMGFPMALVEQLEAGVAATAAPVPVTNYAGRGPTLTQLQGFQRLVTQNGGPRNISLPPGTKMGKRGDKPIGTYGYSYQGSLDLADVKEAAKPVSVLENARSTAGVQPWSPDMSGDNAPQVDSTRFSAEPIVAGPQTE